MISFSLENQFFLQKILVVLSLDTVLLFDVFDLFDHVQVGCSEVSLLIEEIK